MDNKFLQLKIQIELEKEQQGPIDYSEQKGTLNPL